MAYNQYIPQIAVSTELYVAGLTEEGREYHAERFIVIAEFDNGMRFKHNNAFPGCVVSHDEDGGVCFKDTREDAKAAADRLVARILAADKKIDLTYWSEYTPVYGSHAYEAECLGMTKLQLAGEE